MRTIIELGTVKRIKMDQTYTCREVRGTLCVIEEQPDESENYRVRCSSGRGEHIYQWVLEKHLEDP